MSDPPALDEIVVERTTDDRIAVVRLDGETANNILHLGLIRELISALEWADGTAGIDGIVLGSTGETFCAGADVGELQALGVEQGVKWLQRYYEIVELLRSTGKPTVAAVSGDCVAGGNELAMGCDLIVASESARFGQPEVRVGSTAAGGGAQMLPLVVGERRARELLLTGELLAAGEAEEIGMINRVVPDEDVEAEAVALVESIIETHSPQAYRVIKSMFKGWHNLAMLHWEGMRDLTAAVWASEEFDARAQAFLANEQLPTGSFSGLSDEPANSDR